MQPYFCNENTFLQTPAELKQHIFNHTDSQSAEKQETNYLWIKTNSNIFFNYVRL